MTRGLSRISPSRYRTLPNTGVTPLERSITSREIAWFIQGFVLFPILVSAWYVYWAYFAGGDQSGRGAGFAFGLIFFGPIVFLGLLAVFALSGTLFGWPAARCRMLGLVASPTLLLGVPTIIDGFGTLGRFLLG